MVNQFSTEQDTIKLQSAILCLDVIKGFLIAVMIMIRM
jgi:hypothetical protein